MKVEKFSIGILGTNCYIAFDEVSKKALIVDPSAYPQAIKDCILDNSLVLEAILLTHGHFDHTMGVDLIREDYALPLYIHEDDVELMGHPDLNLSQSFSRGYQLQGGTPLHDQEVLHLAGSEVRVIHTPGHTPGGCCFYLEKEGILFSGDTLFQASIGRTDFPGGDMQTLLRSIEEQLFSLPDDTLVYPGHMGDTTVGYEKKHNPFL